MSLIRLETKQNSLCQVCYRLHLLFLSALLNCHLAKCDLRRVQWSKHHCKLTRQNSWWARSTFYVTALIAGASAGRWTARVLLVIRQPPPIHLLRSSTLLHSTSHSQIPTPFLPAVILHPSAISLRSKMNSGGDLLLRGLCLSPGDEEEELIGKAVCESPGCSGLIQCQPKKSFGTQVTSKKLYSNVSAFF